MKDYIGKILRQNVVINEAVYKKILRKNFAEKISLHRSLRGSYNESKEKNDGMNIE